MTKGSDNIFPKLIESMNTSDPAAPSDSSWKVYAKANGIFARSSNSVVGPFGAGGSGSITSSGFTQSTARLLGRTTASTGAIEEITVGSGLSLSAGALTATGGGGGSDLVQTNSGAGSVYVPGLRGSPDVKPASPSSFDDEFEALSGWTTLGTLDTSNVSDVPSHWHAKRVEAGVALDGIYKTAPSMPFTVTAHLRSSNLLYGANYNHIGILLTESSAGELCSIGLVTNANTLYCSTYRWTNRTTLATNVDTTLLRKTDTYPPGFNYLRVVVASSTSISNYVSDDGISWTAVASQQAITTSLTVANVGLAIGDAAAAGTVEAWFDWIRFT